MSFIKNNIHDVPGFVAKHFCVYYQTYLQRVCNAYFHTLTLFGQYILWGFCDISKLITKRKIYGQIELSPVVAQLDWFCLKL